MREKMRNRIWPILVVIIAFWGSSDPARPAQETSSADTADSDLVLVIQIGNRLYPTWAETTRVHLNEPFHIGDTEFTAVVTEFLPDFRIIDGEIISVTDRLANPAAHVVVHGDSAAADSSWAFLNFPPHFSPRSFFTFQLKEVIGYEPLLAEAPDSVTAHGGPAPSVKEE
jgi:hypothetical protein